MERKIKLLAYPLNRNRRAHQVHIAPVDQGIIRTLNVVNHHAGVVVVHGIIQEVVMRVGRRRL